MRKNRFVSWFRAYSMRVQLSISFTLLFFVAILIATFVHSDLLISNAREQASVIFKQTASTCSIQFENLMTHVNAISKAPLYSPEIQQSLENGTYLSEVERMRMLQSISETSRTYNLQDVVMYDMNGTIIYSNMTISPGAPYSGTFKTETIYPIGEKYQGRVFFMPVRDVSDRYSFLALRQIYSTSTYMPIGYTAVAVKQSVFANLLSEELFDEISGLALLNGEGEILFESLPGQTVPDGLLDLETWGNGVFETQHCLAYSYVNDYSTYKILLFSEKEMLFNDIYTTRAWLIMISTFIAALTTVIIFLISNNITKPLRSITSLMEKVQDGDTTVRFRALYKDEVGNLGRNFNLMLSKLEDEMAHAAAVEAEKRETQIDILKSQINPHFIYNTMETFRMMALENGQIELSELIACFGKMMRYNVSHINELTTFEQEIEYLSYYIRIQNERYNNRIELSCHTEEGMEKQQLLRLLIQPVVENSILHGMKQNSDDKIHISIHIFSMGGNCIIDIEDDGVGIEKDCLEQLRENLNKSYLDLPGEKSIGLRNIRERITLQYGGQYGITFDAHRENGIRVRITLPLSLRDR